MELEGTWNALEDTNVPEGGDTWANALIKDEFFMIPVGSTGSRSVYSLNIKTLQWTTHEELQECHGFTAAPIDDEHLVIVGGYRGRLGQFLPRLYNIHTRRWTLLPPLLSRHDRCACVADRDKIYAIGGRNKSYSSLATVDVLDLSAPSEERSWETLPSRMNTPRNNCAAVLVGGKIYVVGGYSTKSDGPLNTCEVFDVQQQVWSTTMLPPMTQRRSGPALVVRKGELIVMGGYDGKAHLDTVEIFSLNGSSSVWRVLDQKLNQGRNFFAAAASRKRIIVAGGYGTNGFLDTVENLKLVPASPQRPPLPHGIMDKTHKMKLEEWMDEVAAQKESYQSSVASAIRRRQASCANQIELLERRIQETQRQIQQIETETEEEIDSLRQDLDEWNQSTDIETTQAENLLRTMPVLQKTKSGPTQRNDPSDLFFCPITKDLMDDPVVAVDGYTYERHAIEGVIQTNPVSPMTRESLLGTSLYPNVGLRSEIMERKARQGKE